MSAIRIVGIGSGAIGRAHATILAKPLVSGGDGARTVDATLAVVRSAAIGAAVQPEEPAEWSAQ